MKFTKDWLSDHLSTSKSEKQIIEKLNGIGLEVEKVEPVKNELSDFIVAKIIKANKHPNADRLKLCDVDIGAKESIKGSTVYLTLEPCSHYGKTPPCTKALIRSKVKKVIYSINDPDDRTTNKAKFKFKQRKIKTYSGLMNSDINRIYSK